jgi:hypothetical protein
MFDKQDTMIQKIESSYIPVWNKIYNDSNIWIMLHPCLTYKIQFQKFSKIDDMQTLRFSTQHRAGGTVTESSSELHETWFWI